MIERSPVLLESWQCTASRGVPKVGGEAQHPHNQVYSSTETVVISITRLDSDLVVGSVGYSYAKKAGKAGG
jgi:hypothetical protein